MFDILCQTAKAYNAAIRGERETPESMEQFPSIQAQQAHWQAKDDAEQEALRQQREREQLADVEREERDHDSKWDHPRYDKAEE